MNGPHEEAVTPRTLRDELFELAIDSAGDFAIFTIDPTGVTTSWNTGAQRLFGYTEEEILGRMADVIFTPEDLRAGAADEERAQALAQGRAFDERWHVRKDGSRFWASGLLMPLKDRSRGFVKITRDRTEQHEIGNQLRETEERFRLLATNIPQLVFRGQPDGERHWASPQWVEFTGISSEDSSGLAWLEAVHPDDREGALQAWQHAKQNGEYVHEHRVRRSDGEYRWHQTRARPILSGEWVGTMTDVHDLRDLQNRQQVLIAELQHRTRNLLAVVMSIANHTMRLSPSLDAFRTEFESRLLALSRVQGLLAQGDRNEADVRAIVLAELAAHLHEGRAPEKVHVDGPSANLTAGAAQTMGLALHELATNAIKYGALAQSAGKLSVSWTIKEEQVRAWIVLEWRESNVRMPDDGAPRRRGYGTELIERALRYQLNAETRLDFGPDGVRCVILLPLETSRAGDE
ncbi:sensor histidine kinase [Rhodoligotrophos ferricapiens]|uniref:sensor histidine kinase n=1 Tax=Rhodoligotrophos ferricapiens TaxID=3069264 RepID=UPI00315D863E